MKYLITLITFGFTGSVIWTVAVYSVQLEELRERQIEVEESRLHDGRLVNDVYNEIMAKRKTIESEKSLQGSTPEDPENKEKSILNLPVNSNFDEPPALLSDFSQEEANIEVSNIDNKIAYRIKETSSINPQQVRDYKKIVLSKLFSSKRAELSKDIVSEIETGEEKEYDNMIDEALPSTETAQLESSTFAENVPEGFNFSKELKIDLDLSSKTESGQILPNTRLTIENIKGEILLEGSTDIKGRFQENVTIFTGDRIYVRYYGIGISQEKIEIEQKGEE